MKEIYLQVTSNGVAPVSQEDIDVLKSFKLNQIVRCELYGTTRARSVQQNKWLHAIFRIVASNTENEDWNTPEKVKRNVKMAMKFFKEDVVVHKNKVWFELRSFAFDKMEQNEADLKYNEAKLICAKFLKINPETLEANAQRET